MRSPVSLAGHRRFPWTAKPAAWLLIWLMLLSAHLPAPAATTPPVVPPGSHQTLSAMQGDNASFRWPVEHDDSYTYRWYHDDVLAIPANDHVQTRDAIHFPRLRRSHAGRWQLEVVNDAGSARSPVFELMVEDPPPPVVLPPSGTYAGKVRATVDPASPIHDLLGTVFYYTTNGLDPTDASPRYVGPLVFAESVHLRVRGYADGLPLRTIVLADYVITPSPIPDPPADARLLAHWTFDDTGTDAIAEETGWYPAPWPRVGVVRVPNGIAGGGIDIDARILGAVPVGEIPVPARGGFTVSAWLNVGASRIILDAALWSWGEASVRLDSGGWRVWGSTGGTDRVGTTTLVTDGQWHHVVLACTDDPSNDLRLYVDGRLERRALIGTRSAGSNSFQIGPYFSGHLDDIQVYNFAVGESQVASLRASPGQALGVPRRPRPQPPVIVQLLPQGTVDPGTPDAPLILSVTAQGDGVLRYQWFRDGSPISGATATQLVLQGSSQEQVGTYFVDATGLGGTTRSPSVTVRIQPLVIDNGPWDVAVDEGHPAQLSADVAGRPPIALQWHRDGTPVAGANTRRLDFAAVLASHAGAYTLVASNPGGAVTSRVARLAVRQSPPSAVTIDGPTRIESGATLRLVASASGALPRQVQWFHGDVALASGTSLELVIPNARPAHGGSYRVRVSNAYGKASSDTITVVVGSTEAPSPVITRQPLDLTVLPGARFQLSVVAEGAGPLSYLWFSVESGIPVGQAATFEDIAGNAGTVRRFYVRVSGPAGTTDSRVATVTSADLPLAKFQCRMLVGNQTRIYETETEVRIYEGAPVYWNLEWSSPLKLKAVLYRNDQPYSQQDFVERAWFSFNPLPSAPEGTYHAVIYGATGAVATTRKVTLVVVPPDPPTIVRHPASFTVPAHQSVTFGVEASGMGTMTYQWFHDGVPIPNATNQLLRITSVEAGNAGTYSARVSNPGGSVDSRPATLRIVPEPRILEISATPNPVAGLPLHVQIRFESEGSANVYWWRDNEPLFPTTDPTRLEIPGAAPGRYWVQVTGPGGGASADVAIVPPAWALAVHQASGGTLRAPANPWHAPGSRVVLEAVPDPGFSFLWWTGDHEGEDNPSTVLMDRDRTVSAVFSPTGGTVYLLNYRSGTDLDARVYEVDGVTPLSGASYLAQLYAAPVGGELRPMGNPIPFRNDAGVGYLYGDTVLVRTVPAGQPAEVQVRVWEAAAGATYEQAVAFPGRHGESAVLTLTTGNAGNPPTLPAYLTGLKSFKLRPGVLQPPSITRGPDPVEVIEGSPARFDVQVTGTHPLTFTWLKDGQPIPGAPDRSRLDWVSVSRSDAGRYSVRVTNRLGTVVSAEAELRVLARTAILAVQSDPSPPIDGEPLSLSVQAEGAAPLAYLWTHEGRPIPNANSPTLAIASAAPGTYSVTVSGPGGTASRVVARVSGRFPVVVTADEGGWIEMSPEGSSFLEGTTLRIHARAHPGYLFVAWEGDLASPANPVDLVVQRPVTARARFREVGGTLLLANRVPDAGLDAPVTLASDGSRLAGNAWRVQLFGGPDAASLAPVGSPIPLADAADAGYFGPVTRVVPNLSAGTFATVEVRVWELAAGQSFAAAAAAGGRVGQSDLFTARLGNDGFPASPPGPLADLRPVAVAPARAPSVIHAPQDAGAWLDHPLQLAVQVDAHPRPRFQWRKGDLPLPGATEPTLRFASVRASDAATYTLVAQNQLGSVEATLRLAVGPPARILAVTGARRVWAGDAAELRVEASGPGSLEYRWYRGEPGDTRQPLGEATASPAWKSEPLLQPVRVWVRVSDAAGHVDSDAIDLDARRRPQTLSADLPEALVFGTPPFPPAARSDSGLPVSWHLLAGPVEPTPDGRLAIVGTGSVLLQFTQPGDERYLPADPLTRTLLVTPRPVQITLGQLEQRADGSPRAVTVVTDPPNVPVVVTYAGSLQPPVEPGSYEVLARTESPNDQGERHETLVVLPRAWDLHGAVYEDLDGNGHWTVNESGIEGVPVLLSGRDLRRVAHTDAEGRFLFPAVPEGVFTVEQLSPQGFALTTIPARVVAITSRGTPPHVEFGNQPSASVGGIAFEDTDGDGQPDPDEPGLGGLGVRLLDASRGARHLVTQSDGRYRFDSVPFGAFTIELAAPDNLDPTSPVSRSLALPDAGSATVNFGLRPRRTILGVVFDDANGNGLHDPGEAGLPDVVVRLFRGETTEPLQSITTDFSGRFAFRDLPGGDYRVEQLGAPGHVARLASASPTLAGTAADPAQDPVRRPLSLPGQGSASTVFPNYRVGTLSGWLFADHDGNQRPDPAEPGLGGIHVVLQDADTGATLDSTFTTANGHYRFPTVPTRRVRVLGGEAPGHLPVLPGTTLPLSSRTAAQVHLPYRTLGTVSGRLFVDADHDAVPSPGEPGIAGVSVQLLQPGQPTRTAFTTGSGVFVFTGLRPGEGLVTHASADGYQPMASTQRAFVARPGSDFAVIGNFAFAEAAATGSEAYRRWADSIPLAADQREPSADPDRDGVPNLLEYVMGSSPVAANRDGYPRVEILRGDPSGPVATFLLSRHRALGDSVQLEIEVSSDLVHWTPLPPVVVVVTAGETTDLVRLLDPRPTTPVLGPRFVRLAVRIP